MSAEGNDAFRLATFRWLQAHPAWETLGHKRKEIAVYLALNESDAHHGTLTHRSVREMAKDSGYTRDQIKDTLTALRKKGLAYSEPVFADAGGGYGRVQIASRYFLAKEKTHTPSERRQQAARLGLARKAMPVPVRVGRIPFSPRDDRQLEQQLRNRRWAS